MTARIAVIAPTPAPYRAWEFDHLQTRLADRFSFHLMFMERRWQDMQWADDVPKLATWETLPTAKLGALHRLPGFRRVNCGTARRLDALRPDAVILVGWDAPALWAGWLWARRHRAGLLLRTDSNHLRELTRPAGLRNRLRRSALGAFFSRVDAFLTIGSMNEAYYRMYGGDPSRFFRSSYMVDTEVFAGHAQAQRKAGRPLKAKLGIRQRFVVTFAGRFVPLKGIDLIIQAFLKAGSLFHDVALLLIGDGPLMGDLQRLAGPLGDRVHFVGFKQPAEIGDLFGISDALVLPSFWDAWGMVVDEAFAAGLPVIASDQVGAACDLIVPGQTGYVFPKGDVESLLESLRKALLDAPGPEAMGQAAMGHLKEWNSNFDVADGFARALEHALGKHGSFNPRAPGVCA